MDRFFHFSAGERQKEREKVSKLVIERTKRRIVVTHRARMLVLWSFILPKLGPFSGEVSQ